MSIDIFEEAKWLINKASGLLLAMKKLLLMVIVAVLSFNVIAATCTINGYTWTYSVNNGNAMISAVSPTTGLDLEIPEKIGSYDVKRIFTFDSRYKFTGLIVMPENVVFPGANVSLFSHLSSSGYEGIVFKCPPSAILPASALANIILYIPKIFYTPKYAAEWRKVLSKSKDGGIYLSRENSVMIISSKIRDTDPTIMDVVYKVASSQPTVKVRALAFKDGKRSWANVVRPETFVEGTDANIGDAVAANVEHKLSWKVSSDWQETLAKVNFEVLALDGELLPLEIVTLPKTDLTPKVEVSYNMISSGMVYDALLWLYADKDVALQLTNGNLNINGVKATKSVGLNYLYQKMGYEPYSSNEAGFVKDILRKSLSGRAIKVFEN